MLTFGCSASGQLGHGSLLNSERPTKVAALLGRDICQVSCGRYMYIKINNHSNTITVILGDFAEMYKEILICHVEGT